MTNEEKRAKRVELAKEVLTQLDARAMFTPTFGNYCRPATFPDDGKCEVCATGALLVACCGVPKNLNHWGLGEDEIIECLKGIFDVGDLAYIEAAFEASDDAPLSELADCESDLLTKAAGFVSGCAHPETRMRRIMQNIIDNDGEFRP